MQSTGMVIFWLVIVLAMIPAALWLLKRSGLANAAGGAHPGLLKAIGQVSLGQGQRVVTIELNDGEQRTWMVLGVTGQQITTLHTQPAPASAADEPTAPAVPLPPAMAFAQFLRTSVERARSGAQAPASAAPPAGPTA